MRVLADSGLETVEKHSLLAVLGKTEVSMERGCRHTSPMS